MSESNKSNLIDRISTGGFKKNEIAVIPALGNPKELKTNISTSQVVQPRDGKTIVMVNHESSTMVDNLMRRFAEL